jgi:hypothetical protein
MDIEEKVKLPIRQVFTHEIRIVEMYGVQYMYNLECILYSRIKFTI